METMFKRHRLWIPVLALMALQKSRVLISALRPPPPKRPRRPKNQSAPASPTSTPLSKPLPIRVTASPKVSLETQLAYARNGHAVLRKALPVTIIKQLRQELVKHAREKELTAWQQKVAVAITTHNDDIKSMKETAAKCQTVRECQETLRQLFQQDDLALPFLQFFQTRHTCPTVLQVARDLAETAGRLMMDCDNTDDSVRIRLYQDALFWKRGNDGPTPWHADARMAPFDTNHLVTLWIPLEPIPADGTGLVFCSTSHADYALPYWHGGAPSDHPDAPASAWDALEERYSESTLVDYMPLDVGDITAHAGWTLHCANGNANDNTNDRMALALTFVDAAAPIRPHAKTIGDNEDAASYADWIDDVPVGVRGGWEHAAVPILWSNKRKRPRLSS